MAEYTYDILTDGIEQGSIEAEGNIESDTRVRSTNYIELHNNITSIIITATSSTAKTVQVSFEGYSAQNPSDRVCSLYWYNSPKTFDLTSYSTLKYFRICIRYSDNSTIVPSEITSAESTESYRPSWRIENDIFTHEALPDMIPQLVQPYPPGIWWIKNNTFEHVLLPTMIPQLVPPYPPGIWYIEPEVGYSDVFVFKNLLMPTNIKIGAFHNCTSLTNTVIPRSVTSIGEYSFNNTQLTDVTISRDCTYETTSFPEDINISNYPD